MKLKYEILRSKEYLLVICKIFFMPCVLKSMRDVCEIVFVCTVNLPPPLSLFLFFVLLEIKHIGTYVYCAVSHTSKSESTRLYPFYFLYVLFCFHSFSDRKLSEMSECRSSLHHRFTRTIEHASYAA